MVRGSVINLAGLSPAFYALKIIFDFYFYTLGLCKFLINVRSTICFSLTCSWRGINMLCFSSTCQVSAVVEVAVCQMRTEICPGCVHMYAKIAHICKDCSRLQRLLTYAKIAYVWCSWLNRCKHNIYLGIANQTCRQPDWHIVYWICRQPDLHRAVSDLQTARLT